MPNPKLGTVTPNVAQAVKDAKGGQVQFRADKTGNVNAGVGKASFTEDALLANVNAFIDAINKARPSGVKGTYIKKATLSSTHGARRQAGSGRVRHDRGGGCRVREFRRFRARALRRWHRGLPFREGRRLLLSETAGAADRQRAAA